MEISMIILALLAIIINIIIAYNALLRPTFFNIKELSLENKQAPISIYDQERLAFIFLPIVGYITFYIMSRFGFSDHLGTHYVPAFILIQVLSFSMYFYSRKKKYNASITTIALLPSVLILGIITCIILAIKLFYCYIICITIGWIFIILPFCVLSYYALYQVIAFQSMELYKLFNLCDRENNLAQQHSSSRNYPKRNELFVLQIILSAVIFSAVLFVFSWDVLGPFQISTKAIMEQGVNFLNIQL